MLSKKEPAPDDLKNSQPIQISKDAKISGLSGKHALGRKSRMCLDILVVWWFEILKAQSIQ